MPSLVGIPKLDDFLLVTLLKGIRRPFLVVMGFRPGGRLMLAYEAMCVALLFPDLRGLLTQSIGQLLRRS